MHSMVRIMVFDRLDNYLCDIEPDHIVDTKYTDEINGEHSITITTTQMLEKTNRLLIRDGMGIWHEYVVLGIVCTHENKHTVINEYYCIWSLQYDLSATFINGPYDCGIVPGHASIPQLPRTALEVSIGGTSRWVIGTITVMTMAAASFYRRSGWEGLQTVIEKWGGEIQATITVGANGVVSRAVDLLSHVGSSVATRRFDYGHDIKGIKRTVSDDVWPCRIVPLGKAQETENGGYTRRPSIESVNDGIMWIQDDDAAPYVRIRNPEGEWEYPTVIVYNDTYEEPADLLAWAIEHKSEYTRPKVTYQASLAQFVRAGLHPHGIALGDEVVAVDRTFGDDGLRITARVVKIVGNFLDPSDTTLTIGNIGDSFTDHFAGLSRQVSQIADAVSRTQQYQSTAEYVDNLLTRINGEVNATGGYTYITDGEGLRTYDRSVTDPLVGAEATKVVEIKGGNIRIADSRTSGGDWDWKTLLQSGHILAELVTAAQITAGYIGSPSGDYWDLDSHELRMSSGAMLGSKTVQQVLDGVDATITGVDVEYASSQSDQTAPTTGWSTTAPAWQSGYYIWSRTATTAADGTTYSTPVMISGRDGIDGQDGDDGVGISSTTISYGTSASGSTQPSSWQSSIPSVSQGQWIWVKTEYTYTDSSTKTVYTKSYVGTDGEDGKSVYVQSSTKSGGTTTVVLTDGTTPITLTIVDGEDGTDGTPGTNGLNGYVHVAWATSADGSQGFSTSVSTGKTYIGVYTDNTQADSQTYTDYSWSLIKGADGQNGQDGADGIGITSIVEQYYLSTSSSTQTGGSWSATQPTWESGKYIWTRSQITWDTTPATTTTTTPILAQALMQANSQAKAASDAVDAISSQDAIFNLLTNNGALQGLYMHNGNLYMNATYIDTGYLNASLIHGGTLKLGGGSNGNGKLEVYDSSDTKIGTIDNTGADLTGQIVLKLTHSNGTVDVTSRTEAGYVSTVDSDQYFNLTGGTSGGVTRYLVGIKSEEYASNGTLAGRLLLLPQAAGSSYWNTIASNRSLMLINNEGSPSSCAWILLRNDTAIDMAVNHDPTSGAGSVRLTSTNLTIGKSTTQSIDTTFYGNLTVKSAFTKSKAVDTEDYNTRLLYCDETPSPMFSDVGGGVTDTDGECVVMVDPIFAEAARTDLAYHVFLQPCGQGSLYVAEKSAWYFVVRGTPNLAFDWQLKARQIGFENDRLEDMDMRDERNAMGNGDTSVLNAYSEELAILYATDIYEQH